jgi:hypothetical protein
VSGLLSAVKREFWEVSDRLTVELIVPRWLFCYDLTDWSVSTGGTLMAHHPVVFRWLDRFIARSEHPEWRRKWKAALDAASGNGAFELKWLPRPGQYAPRELSDSLADGGLCVALDCAPPDADHEDDFLKRALRAGTPIALWLRETSPDEQIDKRRFEELVSDGKLTELPHRIKDMRRQARESRDKTHPGRRITVLYDDAQRVYEQPKFQPPPILTGDHA